ncbi:hypothetical protein [Streptomyces ureilyticus]|uniref:Uncharacterized protein n=1 Tax=Streptomyces ureilyticus TaxID=1775131 RepID=A0ABX0DQZ6_9ACTN|nr:hypothetical protein [Streptomyces ureilyticus]NGO42894.1 hypothetical protein [Streptomyces ureilyticus]
MSQSHDAFVHARLTTWQRRLKDTAAGLVPPQTGSAQAAFVPVLDQLVAVYNLASGLVADLRQSADSSLATTAPGRAYLAQLATALAHSNRAATHLSTAVFGLADAHRLTPRPGTAAPVESELSITLGHAAALRSLQRALEAVPSAPPDAHPGSAPSPMPTVSEQHRRAADTGSVHPVRRRP